MVSLWTAIFWGSLTAVTAQGPDCYSTDPSPFRQYGTKTSYDDVRGQNVSLEDVPGCRAAALHAMIRHGSRYPTRDLITSLTAALPGLQRDIVNNAARGRLCDADVTGIANWAQRMVPGDQLRLSDTGRLEAFEAARRYQKRYPSLLNKPYSKDVFKFKHTDYERVRDSAIMFSVGLFNSSEGVVFDVANSTDPLLRYFANCEKYDVTVKQKTNEEYNKFKTGSEINATVVDIVSRLGLMSGGLDLDTINLMYEACRFEHMIYRDAPWCAAFDLENLKRIEYLDDLKYWFQEGYAHNISWEMACPLVQDLVNTFDNARQGSPVQGVFRFGHSPNTNTYLARLGLYRDDQPLRADNYAEMANRKWVTGRLAPMNSNVAFALYACDDGQYRVKGFVNEHPIVLPGCERGVCLYETLRAKWGPIAATCNLNEICRVES